MRFVLPLFIWIHRRYYDATLDEHYHTWATWAVGVVVKRDRWGFSLSVRSAWRPFGRRVYQ